ncbi:hypothetical protein AWB80_02861 [Caballeronia pedi]|uniref:Uncharacterized protein n=1 Tax=Caballeronia pedi TaxID=1777141 RepID=A0A158B103_9BURK|nr:hypothetical protein [Caballeronia pedi]SAK63406.1 hypothetical protein AWB80_02861 [Caballeronia pedi]
MNDMARIRTVKPKLFTHEALFDAEHECGLPLRLAFIGLFTEADREGRFQWRPRTLKAAILPFDDLDFSRVLDALATRGFLVKYASRSGEVLGAIPTFRHHQAINNKEQASELDAPSAEDIATWRTLAGQGNADALRTRESRVTHASPGRLRNSRGEGKGKEGSKPKTLKPKTEGSSSSRQQTSRARTRHGDDDRRDETTLALRKIAEEAGLRLTPKTANGIEAAAAEGVTSASFAHAIAAAVEHGAHDRAAYALKTVRAWQAEGSEPPLNGRHAGPRFDEKNEDRKRWMAEIGAHADDDMPTIDVEATEVLHGPRS